MCTEIANSAEVSFGQNALGPVLFDHLQGAFGILQEAHQALHSANRPGNERNSSGIRAGTRLPDQRQAGPGIGNQEKINKLQNIKQRKELNDITITYPEFPESKEIWDASKRIPSKVSFGLPAQNITGPHFYVNGATVVTFEELEKLIAKLKSDGWCGKRAPRCRDRLTSS